jgi:5'-3' exonuclease
MAYDVERVIDDFVLLCILVGNDFMPNSPVLDISEGAMDTLFEVYRKMLPHLKGYLTHAHRIDHARLQLYLEGLAEGETDVLVHRAQVCTSSAELNRP